MNRRELLLSSLATGAALAAHVRPTYAAGSGSELANLDGCSLAALVRRREVTPTQLIEHSLAALDRINPKLNAVTWHDSERARALAKLPMQQRLFDGVPYLIKNTQDYVGFPVTRSCRLLSGNVSKRQSAFTDAIDATGAIALGLTNVPELALLPSTEPVMYGATRNPWDLQRSAGGSSGGSAAAVAAGLVPFATGSDGGGSIRGPAANCGIFGFKGSRAVERAADDEFTTFRGCLSRSVRDTATFFAATQAPDPVGMEPPGLVEGPGKRRLRIAFSTRDHFGHEADAEVRRATQAAAALLRELGHEVSEQWFPGDGELFIQHFFSLWRLEPAIYVDLARQKLGREPDGTLFEPWLLDLAHEFKAQRFDAVERAYSYFRAYQQQFRRFLQKYDVYVTPVHPTPPPRLGEQAPTVSHQTLFERVIAYASYCPTANVCGVPSMSVPLHWTDGGLPVGTLLTAGFGHDRMLLELAYELELARPWARRWPSIPV